MALFDIKGQEGILVLEKAMDAIVCEVAKSVPQETPIQNSGFLGMFKKYRVLTWQERKEIARNKLERSSYSVYRGMVNATSTYRDFSEDLFVLKNMENEVSIRDCELNDLLLYTGFNLIEEYRKLVGSHNANQ